LRLIPINNRQPDFIQSANLDGTEVQQFQSGD
jgi:hypothetical protein